MALGLHVLAVWFVGEWGAAALGITYVPTAPITALLFVILGTGQMVRRIWPERQPTVWFEQVGAILGVIVSVVALGQSWMGYSLTWESWFNADHSQVGAIPFGRMAPLTALAFLFSAVAILSFRHRKSPAPGIFLAAGTCSLLIGMIVIAGYAAGIPLNYGSGVVPMAWLTALGFVLLGGSVLLAGLGIGIPSQEDAASADSLAPKPDWKFTRGLIVITLLLGALVLGVGLNYVRRQQTAARETAKRELDAVANLRTAQLAQWREERLAEGRFLQNVPPVAVDIAAFLSQPENEAAGVRVRHWLEAIKGGERYEAVLVYDADRKLRLVIADRANAMLDAPAPGHSFPSSGEVMLSDLEHHPDDDTPHLVVIVPIPPPGHDGAERETQAGPIATILLRINPHHYLFPLIQRWPLHSRTAELLLVRREGDEVVILNEPRHLPGAPLALRRPLHEALLPAAMGLLGEIGVQRGIDYRGVPVLAAMRPIPGSTWLLVAKIDLSEVYEPVRREAFQSGLLMVLLLVTLGLGSSFVWRQRQALILKRALVAEKERVALASRLALVMRYANDTILVMDDEGRILETNERGLSLYGYALEELRRLPPGGLRAPESAANRSEQFALFDQPGGALYETVQRRKDGSTFPVEISGTAFALGGERFKLGVIRDISQRKMHERQLERLNRLYAVLGQVNQAIVHAEDRRGLLQEICCAIVKHGRFQMAWIGWLDPGTKEVRVTHKCGDSTGYIDRIRVYADDRPEPEARGPTGTAVRTGRADICHDILKEPRMARWRDAALQAGYRSSIAVPIRLKGEVCGALTVYASEPEFFAREETELLEEAAADITFGLETLDREEGRRQAETALAAAEEKYRNIFANAVEGIYQTTPEGAFLSANPAMARILGYDSPEELMRERRNIGLQGYVDPAVREEFRRRVEADGMVTGFESEAFRSDGTKIWLSENARVVRDGEGRVLYYEGTLEDITERKRGRARILEQLEELKRWHEATLGREERIMELKREVNELLRSSGAAPRYETGSP